MAGETVVERAESGVRARLHASAAAGAVVADGASPARRVAEVRHWLAGVDGAELTDRERIDLVAELERLKGSVSAAQARTTDVLRRSRQEKAPQDAVRSLGSEVALARRESPTLGDRLVGLSRALVNEMPCTMRALTEGVIGERHAVAVVQATATLSLDDRAEADRRVGPLLGRLGVNAAGRAAGRVAAELDAASVVRRMEEAARSRRVTVRPAPDGMAYLTVLAPLRDAVGALAALRARATRVVGGQCPDESPDGRGLGAVMADTATRLMSGRAVGQVQPVEVHLVMTDAAVFGPAVAEPARIPGHGSVPAPVARGWLRDAGDASVWLRRLYTSPDGRDLVAMDSRRRVFTGLLRRMLVLRDDRCTTPWCDGLVAHADHATPAREGSATDFHSGNGKCARCNYVKEAPGWRTRVVGARPPDLSNEGCPEGPAPHELELTTPLGRRYRSVAPPLLGWGWQGVTTSGAAVRGVGRSGPAVGPGAAVRGVRRSGSAVEHVRRARAADLSEREAWSSRVDPEAAPRRAPRGAPPGTPPRIEGAARSTGIRGVAPRGAHPSPDLGIGLREPQPGPAGYRATRPDTHDATGSTLQRFLAGLVDVR